MAKEPSRESRRVRALFPPADPMSDGRYIFLLVVFVLSVVVFAAALATGPMWWWAVSGVLTGVATGGSALLERQRRMAERATSRRS